jgi:predicted membrane chloride channel (bestrophin family)
MDPMAKSLQHGHTCCNGILYCCLQALSSIVAASDMDPMAKTRLDGMLTLYTFEFGACGRIYNTAIPFCYTR